MCRGPSGKKFRKPVREAAVDRIQGTAIKKCKVQEIRIFRKKFRKTLEKTKKVHEEVIDFPINSTYNRKVLQSLSGILRRTLSNG